MALLSMHRLLITLLVLGLAAIALPAKAQDFPARPDGPVLDQAGIIPDGEETAIDQKLRAYNASTGRAIIVVTVNSLDGLPADMYALELAETWGVSGAETEEGVLLLIAPSEREMWITTARGVQDRVTDIFAGQIVRNTLRPAFREGDFGGGIDQATDQIMERLNTSPAQAKAIAEAEAAAERNRQSDGGFPIGTIIWLGFLFFFFVLPMLSGRGRRRRYHGSGVGGAIGDIILWEAGKAIARGVTDSDWGGGGGFGGGSFSGGGGFGGFGGGGGGFNGGGAGGGW